MKTAAIALDAFISTSLTLYLFFNGVPFGLDCRYFTGLTNLRG